MADVRIIWVNGVTGVAESRTRDEVSTLQADPSGFVWVDVPEPDSQVTTWLQQTFGLHEHAVATILERSHVPRLHIFGNHVMLVLHRPLTGEGGHVHYLELDQIIGPNFLITTHGPRNTMVLLDYLLEETDAVARRILAEPLRPATPGQLSYRIVSRLTSRQEEFINDLAREVGLLEQRVMSKADDTTPTEFLDELFRVRHALLTVNTMTSQSAEIYGRAIRLLDEEGTQGFRRVLRDLKDQYDRLARVSHSQLDFLAGVTEYFRARTDTKMTIAAERLAVIAAVTLPVTALSSLFGMNVIVFEETNMPWLGFLIVSMSLLSFWLLRWTRKQGWW